jgi:hypothetical protein
VGFLAAVVGELTGGQGELGGGDERVGGALRGGAPVENTYPQNAALAVLIRDVVDSVVGVAG